MTSSGKDFVFVLELKARATKAKHAGHLALSICDLLLEYGIYTPIEMEVDPLLGNEIVLLFGEDNAQMTNSTLLVQLTQDNNAPD